MFNMGKNTGLKVPHPDIIGSVLFLLCPPLFCQENPKNPSGTEMATDETAVNHCEPMYSRHIFWLAAMRMWSQRRVGIKTKNRNNHLELNLE